MFCWRGMPGWPLACVSTDTVSAPTNARPISHLVCCALSWPRVVQGQVPPPPSLPPSRDNMNMTTQHLPRPTVNTAHCAAAGHLCGDTRICSRASNEGSRSLKLYNHQARRRPLGPIPYDLCVGYPISH